MKIFFIGTSTGAPEIGKESPSFIINGKILVDTGWCGVLKMREYGLDPMSIQYLILTHLHQDHYLGLPHILFYRWGRGASDVNKPVRPLVIIGPAQHLSEIVEATKLFLQWKRFPEIAVDIVVAPLAPGETYKGDDFILETIAARHVSSRKMSEESLVCKITERVTGKSMVFTGDTSFHEPIAEFAAKTALLVHDAAHTAPEDVARIAKMASAGKLFLIHCREKEGMMDDVRRIFPEAFMARDGSAMEI